MGVLNCVDDLCDEELIWVVVLWDGESNVIEKEVDMLRLYVNMNVLVVRVLVCSNASNYAYIFALRMFG